jgi:hypothetical protein
VLPPWIERMSPGGRAVLVEVSRRCGIPSHSDLIEATTAREGLELAPFGGSHKSDAVPPNAGGAKVSRQARHAQFSRARSTMIAGSLLLAATEDEVLEFVLSGDYTWLRPYTADTQFKWPLLTPLLLTASRARCERLFERGMHAFFDLTSRLHQLDQVDVLRVYNTVALMYMGPLLHRHDFIEPWTALWDEATHRGLLNNPHLRIRLGVLGSWAGTDEAQIEGVFDESLRDAGLADAYCFVRNDTRDDVYASQAALIRGERVDPTSCLVPTHRSTTIRLLIDYVRASFRDSQHLRTAGQVLYLLTGLTYAEEHALRLKREGLIGSELDAVMVRLKGFGSVQLMEKRRFWQLCDRLPQGVTRDRLIQLWNRDFGADEPATLA